MKVGDLVRIVQADEWSLAAPPWEGQISVVLGVQDCGPIVTPKVVLRVVDKGEDKIVKISEQYLELVSGNW